jgi:apolipoprotein D and lipocalin family protein
MHARKLTSLFGFIGVLAFGGIAHAAAPVPVAAHFDLGKFAGGWFEIASMSTFGSSLRSDAIAAFASSDAYPNTLQATFSYRGRFTEQSVSGVLSPADDRYPATLLFTWSRPPVTNSEFYVLAVADDYSWALVGETARKNAYVYARTASIDPAILRSLIIRLDTDFDYVHPERSMHCTYHGGRPAAGCAEVLDD